MMIIIMVRNRGKRKGKGERKARNSSKAVGLPITAAEATTCPVFNDSEAGSPVYVSSQIFASDFPFY